MASHADDRLFMPLSVPTELVERLAVRVAEILAERQAKPPESDPWLDAEAAARYIGYGTDDRTLRRGRQRIYDLVSQRRLRFAKDGSRLLFRRAWLDDYLEGRMPEKEF